MRNKAGVILQSEEEEEGEVSDDSFDIKRTLEFPKSSQAKSKDRLLANTTLNWTSVEKSKIPSQLRGQPLVNMALYKSSPPKPSADATPIFNAGAITGKSVFMFKPMKLSSALSEYSVTPQKEKPK